MELWRKKNKEPELPTKTGEIRNMAGHGGDFASAAKSAPESTAQEVASPANSKPSTRSRRPSSSAPAPVSTKEMQDLAKKAEAIEKQRAALQRIGEEMMRDIAGTPYEVWAFLAQDPSLKLTKEEEKDLAEAYWLVAQSISLGDTPVWITAPLFLLSRNGRLVKARMELRQKKAAEAEIMAIENAKRGKA